MTDIWLVRHGEAAASWGEHTDPGLSDLGHQQAEAVAEELLPVVPAGTRILSSPKARALETAQPLADRLGCAIETDPAFIEVKAPVPLEQRQAWLRQFMGQSWDEQPASLWQWRQQMIDALARIEEPTVIFSHFLVINTVLAHVSSDPRTVQRWPDNASSHHFNRDERGLQIVSLGRQLETFIN